MKNWKILYPLSSEKLDSKKILEILLKNRDVSKHKIDDFLNPKDPYTLSSSDFGIKEKQLEKTIARIQKAIKNEEKIIIYGDYDTDGVCATAILWLTLNSLKAKVMPFIPLRDEGYGLKEEKIRELAKDGVRLIITVDQGIVAFKQAEIAKDIGIDLIITDHHLPEKKLPKALAILHTPLLSGAGVAWFLSSKLGGRYLDLAAIGAISDLLPLNGINRNLVFFGLREISHTSNIGLLSLIKACVLNKDEIGSYEIGYIIGPRLNAAGRIKDPMTALRILCTKNKQQAEILAKELNEQNRERQMLTEKYTLHAKQLWLENKNKSKLIFIADESYEEGVIGLIAGKLMEEFYRPTIIVSKKQSISKASARSINGFNIIEAIRSCIDILGPHGGHPLAAGFSIETGKLEEIKVRLETIAEEKITEEQLLSTLKIDMELDLKFINFELLQIIKKMAPFGFGNPQPIFLTRNVKITELKTIGNGSKHLKMKLEDSLRGLKFEGVWFNQGEKYAELLRMQTVDIVFNLTENFWNNQRSLQLRVIDIKQCKNN